MALKIELFRLSQWYTGVTLQSWIARLGFSDFVPLLASNQDSRELSTVSYPVVSLLDSIKNLLVTVSLTGIIHHSKKVEKNDVMSKELFQLGLYFLAFFNLCIAVFMKHFNK